jgi:hypothetical protein
MFDGESISLEESTIFNHIAGLLGGSYVRSDVNKNCFLISDFG